MFSAVDAYVLSSLSPVLYGRSWVIVDFSDTSSEELDEHNAWNPMLELLFHSLVGATHGSIGR